MADLDFNKNDDKIRLLISDMKRKYSIISLGGGKQKIAKQHQKGKLTARERINYLKDSDSKFFEFRIDFNQFFVKSKFSNQSKITENSFKTLSCSLFLG